MSTISKEFTKEQLQQIIETDHVQCGEASSLARIALASLTAEPVQLHPDIREFIFDGINDATTHDCVTECDYVFAANLEKLLQPLYTAPPATEPMKDHQVRELVNELRDIAVEYHGTQQLRERIARTVRAAMLQGSQPVSDELPLDYLQGHKDGLEWAAQLAESSHPQTGDWLYDDHIDLAKAIRKGPDMLDVAGNSPVIPDCWVPCSERLPEETKEPDGGATGYLVLYAEGKEPNGGFNVGVWNVTYLRQWWRGFITHWQPLPAAPQQEAE